MRIILYIYYFIDYIIYTSSDKLKYYNTVVTSQYVTLTHLHITLIIQLFEKCIIFYHGNFVRFLLFSKLKSILFYI